MSQKLVVGLLVLTVIGAIGVGIYDSTQQASGDELDNVLNSSAPAGVDTVQPVADTNPALSSERVLEMTPTPDAGSDVVAEPVVAGEPQLQQQAVSMVGDPWQGTGIISEFDTAGMTLTLLSGDSIYVELGPSAYWQDQGVTLAVGDTVMVDGFFNGDQYHAAVVTTAAGAQIVVRSETGQPLWSGGAAGSSTHTGTTTGNGFAGGNTTVAPEDWLTIEGTVVTADFNALTMQTMAGETLMLQLGEPTFVQQQGVAFAAGDPVSVLGFWEADMFRAGEITNLTSGQRLMLLDPNGRPLWGGPGRAGSQGQGGQGGQGAQGNAGQGTDAQAGQGGQGQGAQGGGQGGQGGQGQGRNQAVEVPASQWETIVGQVRTVEPLALSVQLQDGTLARVALGEVDFWTGQGIVFAFGQTVEVDGYWLNGQFEAGTVRIGGASFDLAIRDQYGRLLWADATSTGGQGGAQGGQGQGAQGGGQGSQGNQGGGNGNGYRGGRE